MLCQNCKKENVDNFRLCEFCGIENINYQPPKKIISQIIEEPKAPFKIGTGWIIFWYIAFFPLGFIFMWTMSKWKIKTKIIITCILIVIIIVNPKIP